MNRKLITAALIVVAVLGLLAERTNGPYLFVQFGAGAAIALGLLLIYRMFEIFEWAAFAPRPEADQHDEEHEEDTTIDDWEIDHETERDWN